MNDRFTTSRAYLIGLLILWSQVCLAQISIRGRVIDAVNSQPIPGVTITISASETIGTVTNSGGEFEFNIPENTESILVSFVGYRSLRVNDFTDEYLVITLKEDPTELNEIVVIGYGQSKKYLEATGALSLITVNDIQRGDEVAITSTLNRVPGVYMHSGTLNTNRITMRGIGTRSPFSTTKIRAYLNEIPLTSGVGETAIEDIDLDFIERVEVVKGPSSSIYGAGLGGTINYSVGKPEFQKTSVDLGAKFGSYGLLGITGGFTHSSNKWNLRMSYGLLESDGYRDNNYYDRSSFNVTAQKFIGKTGVLTFLGNWISLKAFIPSSLSFDDYINDPRRAAFTWGQVMGFEDYNRNLYGLNYETDIANNWSVGVSTFFGTRSSFELRPFNTLVDESTSLGLRSYFNYEKNRSRLRIGFELFDEEYVWSTLRNGTDTLLSDNFEDREYQNVFAQYVLNISDKFQGTLGLNLNSTSYDYSDFLISNGDDSGDYSFDTQLSPRLALLFKPNDNRAIFLTVSQGFSPPTLEETLTPDGVINPDIVPETGWNFELGSRGALANSRLTYDASIYQMFVDNLLVAKRVMDDIFIGLNAGKTSHFGFETSLAYNLIVNPGGTFEQSNLYLTYQYNRYEFDEFVDGDDDFSGNELTGTPPNKLNMGYDLKLKSGPYTNLEYQFVDAMPMNDANTDYSDSYSLFNWRIGFRKFFVKRSVTLDLYAGINNLTDTKYASMISINAPSFSGNPSRYYYPGLPRNYFGGIKFAYNFN